jgi:hypothetical protein
MEHFERLYLLWRAQHVAQLVAQARERGETFHPSGSFLELRSGLRAMAHVAAVKEGEPPALVLRVRWRPQDAAYAEVAKAQHGFFEGNFTKLPALGTEGYLEFLAYAPYDPAHVPLRPVSHVEDDARPGPPPPSPDRPSDR